MAGWVLVADLESLRNEFNVLSPGRDKASDGSIGDAAHKAESSDHNPDDTAGSRTPYTDTDTIPEVHAIDVDSDLRKSGWDMQRCVDIIVGRHHAGKDDRLQNVIYNHRVWSRSWGWTPEPYTGVDPHTNHAHFSGRYGSGSGTSNPENNMAPWGLLEALNEGDDMTIDELNNALKEKPDGSNGGNLAWNLRKLIFTYPTNKDAVPNGFGNDFGALYDMVKELAPPTPVAR